MSFYPGPGHHGGPPGGPYHSPPPNYPPSNYPPPRDGGRFLPPDQSNRGSFPHPQQFGYGGYPSPGPHGPPHGPPPGPPPHGHSPYGPPGGYPGGHPGGPPGGPPHGPPHGFQSPGPPPPFSPPARFGSYGNSPSPFQSPPPPPPSFQVPSIDHSKLSWSGLDKIDRESRPGPPPPTVPQQFGNGAPSEYKFQYSNCTGRRKALLIGINYFGQKGELKGCINDVASVSAFLIERYGYKREDMVILTDDQSRPILQPTRANMIKAFEWLVKDARPNDSLFLHYSGHGGRTEDLDGDEDDGFDDVIYPVDWQQTSHIVDDEIHWRVVRPLQAGVRLTAIFDSCHSATAMDLPYVYSTKGILKEPNLAKEAGQGLLGAYNAYVNNDFEGVANTLVNFAQTALSGNEGYKKTIETRTSPADVVMWAGSKDDQTSADTTIDSKATGAMSWAFISALKTKPQQSYVELLNNIRNLLEPNYTQKPQLSCSHPLDTDLLFVM